METSIQFQYEIILISTFLTQHTQYIEYIHYKAIYIFREVLISVSI